MTGQDMHRGYQDWHPPVGVPAQVAAFDLQMAPRQAATWLAGTSPYLELCRAPSTKHPSVGALLSMGLGLTYRLHRVRVTLGLFF
jgi:hypothetical protein